MGNVYAYVRVSSRDQNEQRQLIAMAGVNVPRKNIYIDKQSGMDFNRPMYKRLLKKLKKDDLLYIKSIDRLGRDYEEILEQWRLLTKEKGVDIAVLGTFIADLVLQLLSFISENERKNIKERQREGIEAAKLKGVRFGRPEKPVPEDFEEIYNKWLAKEMSAEEAAKRCNFTRTTFYNKANRIKRRK